MNQDQEHLRLLSIFHYIMAGVACLLPLFSLIYIVLGAVMASGKMPSSASSTASAHADQLGGWIFIAIGGIFFVIGVLGAILNSVAGRALARHERRALCFVVGVLNCFHMPFGTLLGVFTIIVLARPSVKLLFEHDVPWQAPGPGYPPGTSPFSEQNR